jgi:protein CpxP
MKRQIIIGTLLAATLAGGSYGAWEVNAAPARSGKAGKEGRGMRGEMSPEKRLARMTKVLGLSDAQQAEIKAIFTAEREKNAPFIEKMIEYRKQLHDAARAATFDEAGVRSIATSQATVGSELTVSRVRVQHQINAVLTPEQRELLVKLRPTMEPGSGRPPQSGGEGLFP